MLAETRRELDVPAERLWSAVADVEARPQWHPRLEHARLHGPLVPGTRGELKPERVRAVRIVVEAVEPGRRLVLRGVHGLPVASGHYEHEVEPLADDRCAVTLRMRLEGPAATVIARFFSRPLKAWAQPEPLERLAALAAQRG